MGTSQRWQSHYHHSSDHHHHRAPVLTLTILITIWWDFPILFPEYHQWLVLQRWNLLKGRDLAKIKWTTPSRNSLSMALWSQKTCYMNLKKLVVLWRGKVPSSPCTGVIMGSGETHSSYQCRSVTNQTSLSLSTGLYGSPFTSSIPLATD